MRPAVLARIPVFGAVFSAGLAMTPGGALGLPAGMGGRRVDGLVTAPADLRSAVPFKRIARLAVARRGGGLSAPIVILGRRGRGGDTPASCAARPAS